MPSIYKICPAPLWREAEAAGFLRGAPVDLADGFVHFSTAAQAAETAARHFAGEGDLLLVAVRSADLGASLRWEASRGGALFPHLYGPLPLGVVRSVASLPLGEDGRHRFPAEVLREAAADPAARGWEMVRPDRYIGTVGPLWQRPAAAEAEPGLRRFGFLAEEHHLNVNGVVHGGMIMSFADHALGLTARSLNHTNRQATVQLDTHFLSGVAEGEFVEARCRIARATRSLLFMAADLAVAERPVATSQGVWKVGPPLARPRDEDGVSDARS